MSSNARRVPTASVSPRLFSEEERSLLLESAVLDVYGRIGVPLTDEAEELFQSEVSSTFVVYLAAHGRSSCGTSTWFERMARTMAVQSRART